MSKQVLKDLRASQDLLEIFVYLGQNSLTAADRFFESAEKTLVNLAAMPFLGSPWDSDNPDYATLRYFPVRRFRKYLLFYRPIDNGIEVIRVLHASRDIASIFM